MVWLVDLFYESFIYITSTELISFIYSIKWLIVSESLLFLSCFYGIIHYRLFSLYYYYLLLFNFPCFSIPFSELIILIWSSLSLNASFLFIFIGYSLLYYSAIIGILGCGLSFLFLFIYELYYSLFSHCDFVVDSLFYFTISLHGFHVILGIFGYLLLWIMSYNTYIIGLDGIIGYYSLSLYWHFVDFIWLVVFLLLFIIIPYYKFIPFIAIH